MRPLLLMLCLVGVSTLSLAAAERSPQKRAVAVAPEDASQARVIVKYRADSGSMRALSAGSAPRPQHAATLSARLSLPLVDGRVLGARTQALRGVGLSSSQLAARLAALPDVEWAVVDERRHALAVPNDPYFGPNQTSVTPAVGQWYLRAPDSTFVSAVNAVGAWDVTRGSASITVAIIDTGVRYDHPDLAGKLHPGYDFIADQPTANDGDARDADANDPGDWTTAGACGADEPAADSSWHGTQVAGIIGAATDNGQGIASVGWRTMVLPARVLGRCGGFDSDIIAAMRWAGGLTSEPVANAHPARVLNLSLGAPGACPASYRDAVAELAQAGVSVVAAAGNETGLAVGVPANCPGAIAVAGLRHAGTKVGYSSIGPEVAIAAPAGNCVSLSGPCLFPLLTTTNSGTTSPAANTYSSGTDPTLGTSFSSPIVAGTVALMLAANPVLAPSQVRDALRATARRFPTTGVGAAVGVCRAPTTAEQDECYCTTATCGAGMLDAAAAVAAVAPPASAPKVDVVATPTSAPVGTSIVLNAQNVTVAEGRSIVAYQWAISSGSATFSGDTHAAAAALVPTAAGSITVTLAVTDSAGAVGVGSVTVGVQAPASAPAGQGGDGGGGGLGGGWLAALGAAVWALRRTSRGRPA